MGKVNQKKHAATNPIKPFRSTLAQARQLPALKEWNTKPTAIVLPSQVEKADFKMPAVEEELVVLRPQVPKSPAAFINGQMKAISKLKRKIKRLSKKACKPLASVDAKSSRKPDWSMSRFLYFDFAEATEEADDETQWTIEDLMEGGAANLSGGTETFGKERKRKDKKSDEAKIQQPTKYSVKPVDNGAIVFLRKDGVIHVHGLFEMQVLFGSVEVLGKRIDFKSAPVNVYSPRGNAFLSVKNLNESDLGMFYKIRKLNEKCARLNVDDAVVHCRPVRSKLVHVLEEHSSQVLFPRAKDDPLRCTFRDYLQEDWSVLQEGGEWGTLLGKVKPDSRVMLCGGKGLGKSTLLRYMVNRLLDKFGAVGVVDLDAGQSEFTVAGCVSTFTIKEPLLGPNYTHLQTPKRSIFVPDTDVSANYRPYLLAVKELMESPRLPAGVPVVVNYMGFTKGLGPNLAAAAIALVRPTLVVQLQGGASFKNFPKDLTPENVGAANVLLDREGIEAGDLSHELMKLDSAVNDGTVWELQPRQMRELSILAYLSQALPEDCNYFTEAGVKLYRTNLSDIKVLHQNKEYDPRAVNANLVALCSKVKDLIYECHGWGIVRSVSVESGHVTLITPLAETELEEVDHLILGNVSLPPSVLFRIHSDVVGPVPFVFSGEMQPFAKAPKRAVIHK